MTCPSCLSVSPQRLKHTESDRLQVQIQAYLDNVFDVGTLLEDAETKTAALERVEELEDSLATVRTKRGASGERGERSTDRPGVGLNRTCVSFHRCQSGCWTWRTKPC